jgi:prevent-host-death family protein
VEEIPVTRARAELSELVNRVAYGGERIVLTRHGKAVAAIVSAADLNQLSPDQLSPGHEPAARLMILDSDHSPWLAPAAELRPDEPGPALG